MIRIEIESIVKDITIGDNWELLLREDEIYKDKNGRGRLFFQIQFDDKCNLTGDKFRCFCRKWYLSEFMTKQEIVRTAYKAYEAAVLHEMSEKFLYQGKQIYNPHQCVDALCEISHRIDIRETHK